MSEKSKERKIKNTVIRLNDKYDLVFDSLCMWIEERMIAPRTGKDKTMRVSGYHDNFGSLMRSLDKKLALQLQDITELKELVEAEKQVHEEVIEICKGLKNITELQK